MKNNKDLTNLLHRAVAAMVNENDSQAEALLHEYYVGLARNINTKLLQEDDSLSNDMSTDLTNDVQSDMSEVDSEEGITDPTTDDASLDVSDDMGVEGEEGTEGSAVDAMKDNVQDLESALDQLKAAFEELTGESVDAMDGDEDALDTSDIDAVSSDEDSESVSDEDEISMGDEGNMEFGSDDDDIKEIEEALEESIELSKVSAPANTEGTLVGNGGSSKVEVKSLEHRNIGNMKPNGAKPAMSHGGEYTKHELQKAPEVKDKEKTFNVNKTAKQDKVEGGIESSKFKRSSEAANGGAATTGGKSLISKSVR